MGNFPFNSAFKFYWDAQTIYSAHSPFIFRFMKEVINNHDKIDKIEKIELKRRELLRSKASIPFVEYGAGTSFGKNSDVRKIRAVAKNSLSGPWQCRLIYNMIKLYGAKEILEIGTSLGISSAYFASASPNVHVVSMEGNPSSVEIARGVWDDLGIGNIKVVEGEFNSSLSPTIANFKHIDLAFIDGNHRKEATIEYFTILKSKHHSKSIYIIDDIYWSKGMNEAWNTIISDQDVAFSIDLFRMGIVFFDHTIMPKQHFKLIPYRYKPLAIGLFG